MFSSEGTPSPGRSIVSVVLMSESKTVTPYVEEEARCVRGPHEGVEGGGGEAEPVQEGEGGSGGLLYVVPSGGGGVCGLGGLIGYVVIGIAFPVEVDLQSRIRLDDRVDVGDEVHARDFVGSDDDQPLALGVGVVVEGEGLGSGPGV